MNNVSITAEKLALQPIVLSPITCYVLFANLAKVNLDLGSMIYFSRVSMKRSCFTFNYMIS